jgi:hypothetical protein
MGGTLVIEPPTSLFDEQAVSTGVIFRRKRGCGGRNV